jgi:putative phosphoribosyl transferase
MTEAETNRTEGAIERRLVAVGSGEASLEGTLRRPPAPLGLVLRATVGARREPPPDAGPLAAALLAVPLAVADVELLTHWEETLDHFSGRLRYDVELLSRRIAEAIRALRAEPDLAALPFGVLAHGTLVAATLLAVAREPGLARAIVSLEGRADLVRPHLPAVHAPTLLLVDADDEPVLDLTVGALCRLGAPAEVLVLPFEARPETARGREAVGRLAGDWFRHHLPPGARPAA